MNITVDKRTIRHSYTMVELMTVCAIIAILAGLGAGGYALGRSRIREAQTKSLVTRLTTALESCKAKHGFYPPSRSDGFLTIDFGLKDNIPEQKAFLRDYMRMVEYENLKKSVKKAGNVNNVIFDSYGYPLYYKVPGNVKRTSFDLVSCGEDGKIGATDTKLWGNFAPFPSDPPNAVNTDLDKFDTVNYDDVANF